MTKLMSILAACAFALSLNGAAFAADPPKDQDQSQKPQDQTTNPADQSKQDQDYLAALKRCEGQQGEAKDKCIAQAKQKYNRM